MKLSIYYFLLLVSFSFISCLKKESTCHDNIKNQGERSVDCGGPCTLCSCSDGIQNQGETSPDCGGPCPKCTCEDGKKNQNEEGIDCGGGCPLVCASCEDGSWNQNEDFIDCGGPCEPCQDTCADGKKNNGETGIDCGGPCIPCENNCTTPLGYGKNAYLLSGMQKITVYQTDVVTNDTTFGSRVAVLANFPSTGAVCQCYGYNLFFYSKGFMNMPINETQVFTTAIDRDIHNPDDIFSGDTDPRNKCFLEVDLSVFGPEIADNQKIYIKKIGAAEFNVSFCDLIFGKEGQCNVNTKISGNYNFTIN